MKMKPEYLKRVQEIANNISSSLKSMKLYQLGHKTIDEMVSRLFLFFKGFLEEINTLEFEIDDQGLKWEGKILLSSKDTENDFLFKLYKDGVRLLIFQKGMEKEELFEFLNIFNLAFPKDQDLATILWEKNFNFIGFSSTEALHSFFKKESIEEEKFWEEEVEKWEEKIRKPFNEIPENLKEANEEGESFQILKENFLNIKEFEKEKEISIQKLISNLLNSLNSDNKELVQNAAKNLKLLEKILLEEADLDLLSNLLTLLNQNLNLEEVKELKEDILSASNLFKLSSEIFIKGIPSYKTLGFFINNLPDEKVPLFLYYIFQRKKEVILPLLQNLSIFREKEFLSFLDLIEIQSKLEVLNSLKNISEPLKSKIFNLNIKELQNFILSKLEKPNAEILDGGLKSDYKEVRILTLEKILRFQLKDFLNSLIKEIEKEDFLEKDTEEKEKWIKVTAILGKNILEEFFLSFFERKSSLLTPNIEEQKKLASLALKIIGTKKSIEYLKSELKKITSSPKLKEMIKKTIDEIERREKNK